MNLHYKSKLKGTTLFKKKSISPSQQTNQNQPSVNPLLMNKKLPFLNVPSYKQSHFKQYSTKGLNPIPSLTFFTHDWKEKSKAAFYEEHPSYVFAKFLNYIYYQDIQKIDPQQLKIMQMLWQPSLENEEKETYKSILFHGNGAKNIINKGIEQFLKNNPEQDSKIVLKDIINLNQLFEFLDIGEDVEDEDDYYLFQGLSEEDQDIIDNSNTPKPLSFIEKFDEILQNYQKEGFNKKQIEKIILISSLVMATEYKVDMLYYTIDEKKHSFILPYIVERLNKAITPQTKKQTSLHSSIKKYIGKPLISLYEKTTIENQIMNKNNLAKTQVEISTSKKKRNIL